MSVILSNEPKLEVATAEHGDVSLLHGDVVFCDAKPSDYAIFMWSSVACPACDLLSAHDQLKRTHRLHVLFKGRDLVVTIADDLHSPGGSISARKLFSLPGAVVYRLLTHPSPASCPAGHAPAAGIAVMTWGRNGRRLSVVGVAEGFHSNGGRIFDAVEDNAGQEERLCANRMA